MHLTVWHGGRAYFGEFREDAIRSGEGDSLGSGFYFAEHRKGGEYFAERAKFTDGAGYLYEAHLEFPDDRVRPLDSSYSKVNSHLLIRISRVLRGSEMSFGFGSAYNVLRDELGDKAASVTLKDVGILALTAHERTNPMHGITFLVLDKACISIKRVFKFSNDPYEWQPLPIPPAT